MKKIYIVDALGYIFRAHHALPSMTNIDGKMTSALYGFILQLKKIVKSFSPDYIVAVFDGAEHIRSRKNIFPEYKANRAKTEEDLKLQIQWASKACDFMGIPTLTCANVEADDTIASIVKWARQEMDVYVCSHDKDLMQLADTNVTIINTHKDNLHITPKKVEEKFGVYPNQLVDYLSLIGDASDNIPGLAGVGPKTAAKWLQEYSSIEEIMKHANSIQKGKKADLIRSSYKQLLINKQLITLNAEVSFLKELSFFKKKEEQRAAIRDFFKEMRFSTFLKELKPVTNLDVKRAYKLIQNAQELGSLCEQIKKQEEICIDLETTSLEPLKADIVGMGVAWSEEQVYYIPFNGKLEGGFLTTMLKPLLESKKLIGHHLKYDLLILVNHGIFPKSIAFDTMLASYVLFAHSHRHSLDYLSLEFFDFQKTSIERLIGKGKNEISMKEVSIQKVSDYCCEDVEYTLRLAKILREQITKRRMESLLKIENNLLFVLLEIEKNGIYLDCKSIKQLSTTVNEKLEDLKKEIFSEADSIFNLNSPKQVGEILFEKMGLPCTKKTKTGYATSVEVLMELSASFPIADSLLAYRKLEKLRSTYLETLPNFVNEQTGRIHPTFTQAVAATGRLACKAPNLQNIPVHTFEGKEIRKSFKPQVKSSLFLSADYSQIELRIVAHLSQDETLIHAFSNDEDIHCYTAHLVYGVPIPQVTKKQRNFAKAVNFGIIYGQSPFGLAKQLNVKAYEAKEFIDAYFTRYGKVKEFLDQTIVIAKEKGVTKTILGRERFIKEINSSNGMVRQGAERLAVNTPIQGSAADIMKLSMLEVHKRMKQKNLQSKMILQVHDELIFEVIEGEMALLQSIVKEGMEGAFKLLVPLKVNLNVGKNWAEC